MTSLRTPFSAKDTNFVRQRVGAGGHLLLISNLWHSPFKTRQFSKRNVSMEESLRYLDSWVVYYFLCLIGSLPFFYQNHVSSFSSLQDGRISTVWMHLLQNRQIFRKFCITCKLSATNMFRQTFLQNNFISKFTWCYNIVDRTPRAIFNAHLLWRN